MTRLLRLAFFAAILGIPTLAAAQDRSAGDVFLYSLLTDSNTGLVTTGAKTVARSPTTHASSMDTVAELLVERIEHPVISGPNIDTVAWLMKALGASGSSRYRPLVERAIATYGHDKVSAHGELVLASLTGPAAPEYVAGTVSLARLREELAAERAAIKPGSGDLALIKPGHSLEALLKVMGYPDRIVETVESKGRMLHIRVRALELQYAGRGAVGMDNEFAAGLGWRVSEVWPDIPLPSTLPPYAGDNPVDAALVMTSQPLVLSKLSRRLVRQKVTERALLDIVAERIRISVATKNEFETDALSYFCVLLGNSGDARYADVLRLAADNATASGTRRHAKESLEKLGAL